MTKTQNSQKKTTAVTVGTVDNLLDCTVENQNCQELILKIKQK